MTQVSQHSFHKVNEHSIYWTCNTNPDAQIIESGQGFVGGVFDHNNFLRLPFPYRSSFTEVAKAMEAAGVKGVWTSNF